MENNICKIYKFDGGKGSGFFCNIISGKEIIPVLMTNNHLIDEKYLNENNEIQLSLNDDNEIKKIEINGKKKIYTNKEYDITIIEIKPEKDKINNLMEIDEKIYKNDSNIIYKNKSVYIIHYPLSDKVAVSYGIINNIEVYNINHFCCTESGSSGSPIIDLSNHKIIGIHKGGSNKKNKGIFLKYPINEFINKYYTNNIGNNYKYINIKKDNNNKNNINEMRKSFNDINEIGLRLKINKEDINKDIYFLDNTDYIEDKSKIKHFHDNLKELNESN